ncbi:hypothetical protein DB30_04516 [Enhygromyxa salina]|uniref:Uncharacterized protein n=1 Tax=Enhygromyxa salina TaxID=215803 RepID=A0A0C1ZFB8_9BACT|nr:hypothetical protein DB30_04516 [Enhygromyxa salina]
MTLDAYFNPIDGSSKVDLARTTGASLPLARVRRVDFTDRTVERSIGPRKAQQSSAHRERIAGAVGVLVVERERTLQRPRGSKLARSAVGAQADLHHFERDGDGPTASRPTQAAWRHADCSRWRACSSLAGPDGAGVIICRVGRSKACQNGV